MRSQCRISENLQLDTLQKRFDEIKNQNNQIKGASVLSILKPFFKSMPDTDFETVFSTYVIDFDIDAPNKLIQLPELKCIYLGIKEQANKIRQHPSFGIFSFQMHFSLKNSHLSVTNFESANKQPTFQIFDKQLTQIIPYEIIYYDSLYRTDERANAKIPEKLTERNLSQPYYCYGFKIYEALLENYDGNQMNKLTRFFYNVIDFKWIEALKILKTQIINDPLLKEGLYLIPIFENLKSVEEEIRKNQSVLKPIIEKNVSQKNKTDHLQSESIKKINELSNVLDFAYSYCANIFKQLKNPHLRAACYFLSKKFQSGCQFEEICENEQLGIMIRFLFARRFLAPANFNKYIEKLQQEMKTKPQLEHIMFLKGKLQVINILSNYWDNNPNDLERVALTCGIVIHKLGKGFNKENTFLEKMVNIYQQLLRISKDKQIQKQYMLKVLSVRSSKQSLVDDLIVKPQFKLSCEPRKDDCVFLSMLQKFIYGGDEKWSKLKSKSSVSMDSQKKYYEIQVKHCPYCNFPTPRCSICLDHIKIFTVKSYLNQQIKKRIQKQPKPYMTLSQPLEQALIWCPSCSHGGHFGHLESWFKQNRRCPVDQCQCKCKY